jgi:hypothetical protein
MRKTLAAIVAATVGLTLGAGTVPSAAQAGHRTPGYDPPPIQWGTCASAALQSRGAQCGFLTVPLDYANPSGTKIKLAVSRILHKSSAANYQGVMLTNPGGPGGSGLILSVLGEFIPDGVGGDYDWIGFDPRGVGSSQPSLACDGEYFGYNRPYYVPVTKSLENTWLSRAEGYANACDQAGGARCSTTSRPPTTSRTWTASARRSALTRSTSTASRTARTSVRSTARCTRAGYAGWSWTATSIHGGCGTTPT